MTTVLPTSRLRCAWQRSPVAQWPGSSNLAAENASMCSSAPGSAHSKRLGGRSGLGLRRRREQPWR